MLRTKTKLALSLFLGSHTKQQNQCSNYSREKFPSGALWGKQNRINRNATFGYNFLVNFENKHNTHGKSRRSLWLATPSGCLVYCQCQSWQLRRFMIGDVLTVFQNIYLIYCQRMVKEGKKEEVKEKRRRGEAYLPSGVPPHQPGFPSSPW